jgi:hypothetical protein
LSKRYEITYILLQFSLKKPRGEVYALLSFLGLRVLACNSSELTDLLTCGGKSSMAEELEQMWGKFSLLEEENSGVSIQADELNPLVTRRRA